jgi:KEOPS complex subunit Cgi121
VFREKTRFPERREPARQTGTNNQHSPTSGDCTPLSLTGDSIKAARCTVSDRAIFLRDLKDIAENHQTHVICFNADRIAGRVHAAAAVSLALRAFREGENISNSLEMESLLFAAGSRQCSIAASFGIHEGDNRVYICCFPEREEIWTALEQLFQFVPENWDTIDREKRAFLITAYAISSDELAVAGGDDRIVDLVLERVALLQVMR